MYTIMNITDDEARLLSQLGQLLHRERLKLNESQQIFAERLGISRQTYSRMEKGAATTPIGYWLKASSMLGMFEAWQQLVKPSETNLFEKLLNEQSGRRRAGKRSHR